MSDDPTAVAAAVPAHGAPANAPRLLPWVLLLQLWKPEEATGEEQERSMADLHVMELQGDT